jgi:hypothetical protein
VTLDAEEFAAIEPTLRIAARLRAEYGVRADERCVRWRICCDTRRHAKLYSVHHHFTTFHAMS